jgi:proteasome accessory factor C
MSGAGRTKAAETAATQLKRLLHLIPRLADGEEHPVDEVARLAESSPDALLRDLNALVERYDVPAGWVDGVSIYIDSGTVSVHSDHFLRPMRLTMPELCALELGLMLARRERPASDRPAIDSALARLRTAITKLPANERQVNLRAASVVVSGSEEALGVVRGALRDNRKVRITYRAGAAAEAGERVICPYGVALANGAWYVIAQCEKSEGLRFFRLDRVERAEQLEHSFQRPASFSLDTLLQDGRPFSAPASPTMQVRYSPRIARWVAEREGKEVAVDGSLTLEHALADEDWALRHVLQYGPDAEVLEPVELRHSVAERLRQMAAT